MPTLSTTVVLFIFYLVFACQIGLISLFYPGKIAGRILYVLDHFPPKDYPKLYAGTHADAAISVRSRMAVYKAVNRVIALVGLGIMAALVATGFRPSEKGGAEIFVFGYFMLQVLPYIWLSFMEMRQFKAMREAFKARRRSAELKPRGLSDFISPAYVLLAVVCYVAWVAFYMSGKGPVATWDVDVWVVVPLITGMNIMYILICRHYISGRKLNPLAGQGDQFTHAETTVQTLVISSIMVSLFLIMMDAFDRYALEILDPVVASAYMQLTMIFGVGFTLRKMRPEQMDFDVYKADKALGH